MQILEKIADLQFFQELVKDRAPSSFLTYSEEASRIRTTNLIFCQQAANVCK